MDYLKCLNNDNFNKEIIVEKHLCDDKFTENVDVAFIKKVNTKGFDSVYFVCVRKFKNFYFSAQNHYSWINEYYLFDKFGIHKCGQYVVNEGISNDKIEELLDNCTMYEYGLSKNWINYLIEVLPHDVVNKYKEHLKVYLPTIPAHIKDHRRKEAIKEYNTNLETIYDLIDEINFDGNLNV